MIPTERDYIRLKQMAVRYLEQTFREKHFSSREGQLEKPASGPAAAKGRTQGLRKKQMGDCTQWTTKGHCSPGEWWNGTRPREKTRVQRK